MAEEQEPMEVSSHKDEDEGEDAADVEQTATAEAATEQEAAVSQHGDAEQENGDQVEAEHSSVHGEANETSEPQAAEGSQHGSVAEIQGSVHEEEAERENIEQPDEDGERHEPSSEHHEEQIQQQEQDEGQVGDQGHEAAETDKQGHELSGTDVEQQQEAQGVVSNAGDGDTPRDTEVENNNNNAVEPEEGKKEGSRPASQEPAADAAEQRTATGDDQQAEEDGAMEPIATVEESNVAAEQEEVMQSQDTADEEPRLEDKKTPEPPTEHAGTGMDGGTERTLDDISPRATSPVQYEYDKDAAATVKFVLLPTQQVATLRCYLTQTLSELKQHFARELKIPVNAILLMIDGKSTDDGMSLGNLGVGPNGTIRLEMQSADPINTPIKAFKPRQEYTMPDVITVRVHADGSFKDIVVEIERATRKKPFLGGYRHKNTAVEYHHASAQTSQKPRPPANVERYCRDTQTVKQRHIVQQTTNEMSTQMTGVGVYVSNVEDKLVVPGKYTTADDYQTNVMSQVVIIQKYYRRWLAKRHVKKVKDDTARREEWEHQEELRKKKEKEDRIRLEFERRMNPKSNEDFDLLYHALEKWRTEEEERINSTLSGAERKAALCQLLDQETQLIASIGRHKLGADDENRQKRVEAFLEKAASPKKWRGRDGKTTEMDTPYTIRARELKDIYNSINMKYLTQDERLDVLLTLKHTVKEHDCKLTQEIIELIDREADLLMRGVKEGNLEGLRKRISTLFRQYIRTPTFNPEAARLLKVPQDPSTLRKNIYYCPSCNQYLPSTEFQLSSNSRAVGKCSKCKKTDNEARDRQDYSQYRFMLKTMRRQEEAYADGSKIAFLMQENDLRHLVENVWNSQSILSAWEDLYDLVLVRWDRHDEWSPWNCILLTKEEASAHEKLNNLDEAYGRVFVHKVKHKHTLAGNYFSRLPGMAEHMRGRADQSAVSNGPSVSGKALSVGAVAPPTKA